MKKILVIGSSNVDYTLEIENFPKKGETIHSKNFFKSVGGKGLNQAIAASIISDNVTFLTALGNDLDKDYILSFLSNYNINLCPIIKDTNTGSAIIELDRTGDNKIIVNGGANMCLSKKDIDDNLELIKSSDIIILQLEIDLDTISHIIELGNKYGKTIILNPSPFKKLDYRNLDYLIVNEGELEMVLDDKELSFLFDKSNIKNVIVTLGDKGAKIINKDGEKIIAGNKVKAIDTVGAGDCFTGVFAGCLANDYDIDKCLSTSNLAASKSVTKKGAAISYPKRNEII